MALRSYYAISSYKDKKSLFGFNEGDVVQLMQKDPSGLAQFRSSSVYVCIPAQLGMWKSPRAGAKWKSNDYRLLMCLDMASVYV